MSLLPSRMESLNLNILNVLAIFVSITASAQQVKIAVIDTGYTKPANVDSVNLCESGHYDASNKTETVGKDEAVNGISDHGTHIAHIIDESLRKFGKKAYCLVIFKVYGGSRNSIEMSVEVLDKINNSDISYINYSTAGEGFDKKESDLVKSILDKKITIVASAGNANLSIDSTKIYPAMYDSRIKVVGNGRSSSKKAYSSNYGESVKHWVDGQDVLAGGIVKSGTSQSAAIFTAKIVSKALKDGKQKTR